jgi:hypothetical protein
MNLEIKSVTSEAAREIQDDLSQGKTRGKGDEEE